MGFARYIIPFEELIAYLCCRMDHCPTFFSKLSALSSLRAFQADGNALKHLEMGISQRTSLSIPIIKIIVSRGFD